MYMYMCTHTELDIDYLFVRVCDSIHVLALCFRLGEAPVAKKKEDVHVPAKNIADIKSAEKVHYNVM